MIAVPVMALAGGGIVLSDTIGLLPIGVLASIWCFIFAAGLCFPCTQVIALANHGAEAGTAASVLGAANFMLAGVISIFTSQLAVANAIPMGAMIGASAIAALLVLVLVVRPRTVPALTH